MGLETFALVTILLGGFGGALVGIAWSRKMQLEGHAFDVAGWIAPDDAGSVMRATLSNLSDIPVFGVVVWLVGRRKGLSTGEGVMREIRRRGRDEAAAGAIGGAGTCAADDMFVRLRLHVLPMLPPGRRQLEQALTVGDGPEEVSGLELAFSDATGAHWIRRVDGRLDRIEVPPWRYYGFSTPQGI